MATDILDPLIQWQPQPRAEQLLRQVVDEFLSRCSDAARLAERMKRETGTRFIDWIDHICLPKSDARLDPLRAAGFVQRDGAEVFDHPGGMFPAITVQDADEKLRIALKAESVVDLLVALQITFTFEIHGQPLAPLRRAQLYLDRDAELWAIERHGTRDLSPRDLSPRDLSPRDLSPREYPPEVLLRAAHHLEMFRRRTRSFAYELDGFTHAHNLIDAAIADLGIDWTCDLFFRAEREYWQRRNDAAQLQKSRQDRLGLGWANHDHHTYRSSRRYFKPLIAMWEKLGLVCRERFYAGREAGWGAQVMEQPNAGIITFNDVDLSTEELIGDFSHQGLPPRDHLGTVGLWCALHGEAFLHAGMHHLEAQFDFDALRDQLEQSGVRTMKPFTDLAYLRQAFTEGQRWPVSRDRLAALLKSGRITETQAEEFRINGAIGSHLENLERNEGFKGFNQAGVSEIIAATDPRRQAKAAFP